MTERERWVVYPLLFLALGASLRDKLIDSTTTKRIKCQELLVVDELPLGREMLLARIGPPEPTSAGAPPGGHFLLNGHISANGPVNVNGPINAKYYAYQGMPFVPALRAVLPGVSLPDLLRALPQIAPQLPQSALPTEPPATSGAEQPAAKSESTDAASEPAQTSPPAEPLADPAENR